LKQDNSGRVLLVTGGSRGIGAQVALLAAERGYRVCINYVSNEAAAHALLARIEAMGIVGSMSMAYQADTSHEQAVKSMFEAVGKQLGPVTDLVNSAGIMGGPTRLESLSYDELRRMFEVNVFGAMLCAREAIRVMSTEHGGTGGRVVNVSSVAASHGSAGERLHYAASKGAINAFTVGLAKEVIGQGIRVNAFSPGVTATEMNSPERLARVVPNIPAGRAGTPAEMAKGIMWLLSDEAGYCVGANLVMGGGR
jgi:NAD(P)-dependent dehydrogenase (short-subunit alcohol dehydrogenase family)